MLLFKGIEKPVSHHALNLRKSLEIVERVDSHLWGFRWSPVLPCVQLRNALALCHILNRTLVLPSLTSGAEQWWKLGNPGAVRSTPADFVLDLEW